MNRKTLVALAISASIGSVPMGAGAQGVRQSEAIAASDVLSQISLYSYREGRKSDLFLRGTPIAPTAQGKAQVEYQDGNARIIAEVERLPPPASLGPYTTYVLWSVTPDGRATNQGVIGGHAGGNGQVETQHGASQFALIVTAEPHFAVTMPSTMVALYNVGDDVKGNESKVATLTERADYGMLESRSMPRAVIDDELNTIEVVQARYAIAIARAAGAERFASHAFDTATERLSAAEAAVKGNRAERQTAPGLAREATIAGEDARRSAMLSTAKAAIEADERAAVAALRVTFRGGARRPSIRSWC